MNISCSYQQTVRIPQENYTFLTNQNRRQNGWIIMLLIMLCIKFTMEHINSILHNKSNVLFVMTWNATRDCLNGLRSITWWQTLSAKHFPGELMSNKIKCFKWFNKSQWISCLFISAKKCFLNSELFPVEFIIILFWSFMFCWHWHCWYFIQDETSWRYSFGHLEFPAKLPAEIKRQSLKLDLS